jgi:hypothetical protein
VTMVVRIMLSSFWVFERGLNALPVEVLHDLPCNLGLVLLPLLRIHIESNAAASGRSIATRID